MVGDGPSEPALRAAMPRARFLGRRTGNDLARVFASLDVFAHTGPQETFCQTVQEAQASGVPVVAPAAGGPLDLVDHGRTGLLVPPGDETEVTDAVALLSADAKLRAALGHMRPGGGRGPHLGGDRRPADRPLHRGAGGPYGGRGVSAGRQPGPIPAPLCRAGGEAKERHTP